MELVHHVVHLFTPQLSLVLILPTWRDRHAELTWTADCLSDLLTSFAPLHQPLNSS